MRKTIINILGSVLILAFAIMLFKKASNSKKPPRRNAQSSTTSVVVQEVKNQSLPISIRSTGSLVAKQRSVLYSEVQGVFSSGSKLFKEGEYYEKGQVLININNTEFKSSVQSQRIAFKSLLTSLLADIKFDYPNELKTWQAYINSIKSDKNLPPLPEVANENFDNYLSVKNVNSNYFNIKNAETRLAKYTLTAPFSGVLVKANVTPGTLISPGQSLGEFIKPGIFELQLNVSASLLDLLKIGKEVELSNIARSKNYLGKVIRINEQIDRASQTAQVFVQIANQDLREGEYLEAVIEASNVDGVMQINRNLLVDQNYVYLVDGTLLKKVPVAIVHSSDNKLIVQGLPDGAKMAALPVPGAYDGMEVSIRPASK